MLCDSNPHWLKSPAVLPCIRLRGRAEWPGRGWQLEAMCFLLQGAEPQTLASGGERGAESPHRLREDEHTGGPELSPWCCHAGVGCRSPLTFMVWLPLLGLVLHRVGVVSLTGA